MHDQRGRTSARFSRFSGAAFVPALLLLSTLSCAREPGILINIAAWPDGVERLRVRTNLEGTLGADFFVEKDQSRFAVRVPASSQGAVHIDVVGLDPMGCKLATGSLTELVPGNLSQFVERVLVLSPLSFHVCPFAPAMSFQVRAGLKSIAMGDFDGDLKLDLVVANATTNQISALLGDGMGGFSPPLPPIPTNVAVGTNLSAVGVGDFNGDKKPDLVVASYGSANVYMLLGDGMAGFSPAPTSPFSVESSPYSVAVGDYNGDMKQDLAVANYGSDTVSVLLGDGVGGFSPARNFNVGDRPVSVTVGDFNGDTKPDLAVVNFGSDTVSVLLGDGIGKFGIAQNFDVGRYPGAVAVGDFNHDQKLDLAVTSAGEAARGVSPDVRVLLGNGAGGFGGTSIPFSIPPTAVTGGDFNGDGKPDLAVACAEATLVNNEVRVLLGDGSGRFGLASISRIGKNPISIASADFNRDLKSDVAIANYTSGDVSILLNQFD